MADEINTIFGDDVADRRVSRFESAPRGDHDGSPRYGP